MSASARWWFESVGALTVALVAACSATGSLNKPVEVSSTWAGYVATAAADPPVPFTAATGRWTQPRSSCRATGAGTSAVIWVGIGGYIGGTQALQQIGTTVGCNKRGKPVSSAWFDLLPYPAHAIPKPVRPGDILTGVVTIRPIGVQLELSDETLGWSFVRTVALWPIDATSVEWIVESPSACRFTTCHQAWLANFGSLTFTDISATADGQEGNLASAGWRVTPLQLISNAPPHAASRIHTPVSSSTAVPGPVQEGGASFTITWSPVPLLATSR